MTETTTAGRKVGAEVTVSMDGYSGTGPEDDMSWGMAHIASEQSELYYEGIWRGVSTALLGRTNWEGFTAVWPAITSDPGSSARTRDLGNWLATVEKVVFSTTLEQADWTRPSGPMPGFPRTSPVRWSRSRRSRAGTSSS